MSTEEARKVSHLADEISKESKTDVILISAGIERPVARQVIDACQGRKRMANALVILVTNGGSADAAYRISRCFQDSYERFVCLIPGICKSAGTIVALGAHELAIGNQGELGPLDIQLRKDDELWEYSSGLTAMDTLSFLQQQAFQAFEKYLLDLKVRSQGQITLKTAAEISSNLCSGLYGNIYSQIDPMRLGENTRSMNISKEYGERLGRKGKNLKENAVSTLAASYPSHAFVIDRPEAASLFKNVRALTEKELQLIGLLGELAYEEHEDREFFDFLNGNHPTPAATLSEEKHYGEVDTADRRDDRGSPQAAAGGTSEAPIIQKSSTTNGNPGKLARALQK